MSSLWTSKDGYEVECLPPNDLRELYNDKGFSSILLSYH